MRPRSTFLNRDGIRSASLSAYVADSRAKSHGTGRPKRRLSVVLQLQVSPGHNRRLLPAQPRLSPMP